MKSQKGMNNINTAIIPYGYGTWVYDKFFPTDGSKAFTKPGLLSSNLTSYNQEAKGFTFTQIFAYGGDIEMYCRGSGESDPSEPCTVDGKEPTILTTYPGVYKDKYVGHRSQEAYYNLPGVRQNLLIIDGRMDQDIKAGDYDYLNSLNILLPAEAILFADVVSTAICQDDFVDGVQFDVEPFSFTGEGGLKKGDGQKYFYTQIAKNFAGWNGQPDNSGINPNLSSDPLGCVNSHHPNGRIFSVFTFAQSVTPDVVAAFKQYNNGYIVDSLYDLGPLPGGQLNSVADFAKYAAQEIADMKTKNVPYQFAIPAAASAHEFETTTNSGVQGIGVGNQIEYIKAVIAAIDPITLRQSDLNFKGIDIWSWNQKMTWHGNEYTPASPPVEILEYLESLNLNALLDLDLNGQCELFHVDL